MLRAEQADAELERLYAQVPDVRCQRKPGCINACGVVDGGQRERGRIALAGVKLPPKRVADRQMIQQGHYTCPALEDDRCSVYAVRPMICRLWGAWEALPCPYGCRPLRGRLLTEAEGLALLEAAQFAGTDNKPHTVEEYKRLLQPGTAFGDWFRRTQAANRPKREKRKTRQEPVTRATV